MISDARIRRRPLESRNGDRHLRSWGFAYRAISWIAVLYAVAPFARAAEFVDDAHRRVDLPARVARVFAAGAPAEILLYTLVPEMLGGLNHKPQPNALELIPREYRSLPQIVNLPDRDEARFDLELLALKPDVYVDYGDVEFDYVGALEAISARTHVPGIILDGHLANVPSVYRRLGSALGVGARGELLAAEAERILAKYRGRLTGTAVRAYLACSQNGTTPCVQGHSFGEAAEWIGAVNVAGTVETAPRRPLTVEEIEALAPTVVVAASAASAAQLRANPTWLQVANGKIHAPPDLPFSWGARPPSVNRLLGVIWLAYVLPGRELDSEFFADVSSFYTNFYHVTPTQEQLRRLVAERP
jgi:iron complex transport system substrate-binding protein